MAFYADSYVNLQEGAKVLFQNNTVFDVGGAIFVSSCTYNAMLEKLMINVL